MYYLDEIFLVDILQVLRLSYGLILVNLNFKLYVIYYKIY